MEPKDRLKLARQAAGFERPTDAANAHKEINKNTLISNENGNRPISKMAAAKYGEIFGVDAGWILYGEGRGPNSGPDETLPAIRGERAILDTLKRIEGLNEQDVLVAMSIIMNAIRVNDAGRSQTRPDDQPAPATDRHEVKP